MEKTIVVRFLKIFSKKELIGLKLFIENPCFNSNKDVVKLFHYIEQFAPDYNQINFTAENAFTTIYPNKIFDRTAQNRLMNKLFISIKKFINALDSTSNSIETELKTLRFCAKKYPKKFDNQLKKVRKLIAKKEKGSKFYYYTIEVEQVLSNYLALFGNETNYVAFSEVLDKYYWLLKLSLLAEMLNSKGVMAEKYDFSDLEAYLDFLEKMEHTEFPLINLWHCAVSVLKNTIHQTPIKLQDYLIFKEQLFLNKDNLDRNELRNLYIYLRSAVKISSFEDNDYYREIFELDQMGLQEKLIFLNEQLRPQSVKNIINSAIKVGKIEWAKFFLDEYKDVFWKEFANDIFLYCTAMIDFYEGNYNKSLTYLNSVEYRNIHFDLGKRIMLIQIYYETDEFELFDKEINNLGAFISRNQNRIGSIFAQSHRDFAKYIKKIANIPKHDMDKIQQEISEIPVRLLFEKKWLLSKIDELKF